MKESPHPRRSRSPRSSPVRRLFQFLANLRGYLNLFAHPYLKREQNLHELDLGLVEAADWLERSKRENRWRKK